MLSIKKDNGFSDLKLCFALLLFVEVCNVMNFLVKFRISIIAHQMNWFLFLLLLCKFLLMVPNFWMRRLCCFPVRIRNVNA